MSGMMEFYNNININLRPFIKHIWYSNITVEHNSINAKLIPMSHLDLVIIKKGNIKLIKDDSIIELSQCLFQGLNTNVVEIEQNESSSVFGISFKSWGLYPFVNKSISTFLDKDWIYKKGNMKFIDDLLNIVNQEESIQDTYIKIEEVLYKHLIANKAYLKAITIIQNFVEKDNIDITSFCKDNNINKRKLERDFKRYVGVSPREYKRIKQLVKSSKELMKKQSKPLTQIGQESSFYDQAHFNKHFKKHMNYTPKEFRDKEPALKTKIKFL